MRLVFAFLCGLPYVAALFAGEAHTLDTLCEQTLPAVCELQIYDADVNNGMYLSQGVFIHPDGYLLTDSNLFSQDIVSEGVWVDEEGNYFCLPITCIGIHPEHRAALLKVEHPDGQPFPFLNINFTPPKIGDWVLRISKKQDEELDHYYLGQLSHYSLSDTNDHIGGEGTVAMGSYGKGKGAPYINLEGEIIGIHYLSSERASFFTASTPLKEWIYSTIFLEEASHPSASKQLSMRLNQLKKEISVKTVQVLCHTREEEWNFVWSILYDPPIVSCSGQGFFITPDGYLLTAKHVIEDCVEGSCSIIWTDHHQVQHHLQATIVSEHPSCDAALLKVTPPLDMSFPYFKLEPDMASIGTWTFIGYTNPEMERFILRGGRVVNQQVQPRCGRCQVEINLGIPTSSGDSGGPCTLFNGAIIGIHYGTYCDRSQSICTPVIAFQDWLDKLLPEESSDLTEAPRTGWYKWGWGL